MRTEESKVREKIKEYMIDHPNSYAKYSEIMNVGKIALETFVNGKSIRLISLMRLMKFLKVNNISLD